MKTEWHRYNLKRRVAQLTPISNEVFQSKVANNKNRVQYDDFGFVIEDPDTKYRGKNSKIKKDSLRYNLLNRGRHINNQPDGESFLNRDISPANSEVSTFSLGTLKSQSDYDSDIDDIRSEVSFHIRYDTDYHTEEDNFSNDETDLEDKEEQCEPLLVTACFYCGTEFETLDDNIAHMLTNHGLYIPDLKYLSDKEGLIRFLSDIVVLDKECLKCGFYSRTLLGIRQHIIAKGHACIPYETKEEEELFRRFYDYSELYCDEQEAIEGESFNEDGIDENETEYRVATVDPSGVELALPNGNKLGHRSMIRYYRQNFPNQFRRMSEGEQTVIALNKENNDRLLKLQETIKHNKEIKKTGLINNKITNKQLSNNSLQYRNNLEHYRNQRFG
jgi:hypothetical protein